MSLVTSCKLDLRVLLKLIEVSILSTIRNETLFSLFTERLNQLAASSDAQKVLYGHDLLNHLAPIVMSLDSDARVIPADTISQLLSAHSDYEGEHSLHYFCAHYLVQFHNNFSVSSNITLLTILIVLVAFGRDFKSYLRVNNWSRHGPRAVQRREGSVVCRGP